MNELGKPNNGRCLFCGKELIGRTDKLFCNKQCRNNYHNRKQRHLRKEGTNLLERMNHNHELLEQVLMEGKTSITLEELKGKGYSEALVTGYGIKDGRHRKYACFDIRFCQSETRIFKISKEKCQ